MTAPCPPPMMAPTSGRMRWATARAPTRSPSSTSVIISRQEWASAWATTLMTPEAPWASQAKLRPSSPE